MFARSGEGWTQSRHEGNVGSLLFMISASWLLYKLATGGHGIEASSLPFLQWREICVVSKHIGKDCMSGHVVCGEFLANTRKTSTDPDLRVASSVTAKAY